MTRSATAAGANGRRRVVAAVETARGRVNWGVENRQGVMPMRLLGNMVRVIAYERRR